MPSQQHLPLGPQSVPKPRDLDIALLVHCRTWKDAVRVGIQHSYYVETQAEVATSLGIQEGEFSRMLNARKKRARYFDMDRIPELEGVIGNRCVTQFLELQSKGLLVSHRMSTEEKARAYDAMMRESA